VTDPAPPPQTVPVVAAVLPMPQQVARRPDFQGVYRDELGYVWNTLRRLGVFEKDLPDATHDVFVVVHRKLADYDPARPLRPWLFGIAYRVALDVKRKAHVTREAQLPNLDAADERAVPADERVAQAEAKALVKQGLDALDTDRRAVLVLHDLEGHAIPLCAELLGVPVNTLYSRLRLARQDFTAAVRRVTSRRGR
jgi:RNA polymerase sigma-70 factor, ECF subfamily